MSCRNCVNHEQGYSADTMLNALFTTRGWIIHLCKEEQISNPDGTCTDYRPQGGVALKENWLNQVRYTQKDSSHIEWGTPKSKGRNHDFYYIEQCPKTGRCGSMMNLCLTCFSLPEELHLCPAVVASHEKEATFQREKLERSNRDIKVVGAVNDLEW